MGIKKNDRDAEVRTGYEAMFAEHSGETDPDHDMDEDVGLASVGMHLIPETTTGNFIGEKNHLFEHE